MSTSLRNVVFAAILISTAVAGSVGAAQAASNVWRSYGNLNDNNSPLVYADWQGSNNGHFRWHRNFHDWGHFWPAPGVMYLGPGSYCETLALRLGREELPYWQERAILANHGC